MSPGRPQPAPDAIRAAAEGSARRSSFAGKLEHLALPVLLQFISYNRKSGQLTLTRRDGHGKILFRAGKIVHAASNSLREAFGNVLVCRGLISEEDLMDALERQHGALEERRLGAILVEMGKVRPADVEAVVKDQFGAVLSELLQWDAGFFRFQVFEIPERGEVAIDAMDFVIADGLSTDRLLIDAAPGERPSRAGGDAPAAEASPPRDDAELPSGMVGEPAAEAEASLAALVSDVPAPSLRGEVTLTLMKLASRVVERGVLFLVRGGEITGLGHFGVQGHGRHAGQVVRSLHLPAAEASVLAEAIERKETCRGPLAPSPGNDRLVRELGGGAPAEAIVVPMVVSGAVVMIFYGDNGPTGGRIGAIEPLLLAMAEAGLEMEKQALEGRIESYERARDRHLDHDRR